MPRKKTKEEIDKDINETIQEKLKGLNSDEQERFLKVTGQSWAMGYMRKNDLAKRKLLKKIREGVKQGKYGDTDLNAPKAGYPYEEKPKVKKERKKKPVTKKQKSAIEKEKGVIKSKKAVYPKEPRAQREKRLQATLTAPSGRKYSKTEIHEGVGSKRAVEYRARHNIPKNDFFKE